MSTYSLEVKKKFSAPAEMIYDAWLDPEAVKEFLKPMDVISVPAPQIDAKVGGAFQFDMHLGEKVIPHKGEYKVLDRANKIEFTWNSMNTNDKDSIVTITIQALDENSCELTLVQVLLPSQEAKDDHQGGWTNILKTLGERTSQ